MRLRLNNSSAHAEIVALAMAQASLGTFTLRDDGKPRHAPPGMRGCDAEIAERSAFRM